MTAPRRLAAMAFAAATFAVPAGAEPPRLPAVRWLAYHAGFESGEAHSVASHAALSAPGRRGAGARVGGGATPPEVSVTGVVDLARPGAVTCWVRPFGWRPPAADSDYVPLIRILGGGTAAVVVERDRRSLGRTTDVWVAGFFALTSRAEVQFQREVDPPWEGERWHFVVFQWDATGFSLQIDGARPARVALPDAALEREFPKSATSLVLGAASPEGFVVDELSVWSRQLSDEESAALRSQ